LAVVREQKRVADDLASNQPVMDNSSAKADWLARFTQANDIQKGAKRPQL
jgi:hypothetical protein